MVLVQTAVELVLLVVPVVDSGNGSSGSVAGGIGGASDRLWW